MRWRRWGEQRAAWAVGCCASQQSAGCCVSRLLTFCFFTTAASRSHIIYPHLSLNALQPGG